MKRSDDTYVTGTLRGDRALSKWVARAVKGAHAVQNTADVRPEVVRISVGYNAGLLQAGFGTLGSLAEFFRRRWFARPAAAVEPDRDYLAGYWWALLSCQLARERARAGLPLAGAEMDELSRFCSRYAGALKGRPDDPTWLSTVHDVDSLLDAHELAIRWAIRHGVDVADEWERSALQWLASFTNVGWSSDLEQRAQAQRDARTRPDPPTSDPPNPSA